MKKLRHDKHFALTADIVVFGLDSRDASLDVLLVRRKNDPYKNHLALPGGFINKNEAIEKAAFRELKEETGIVPSFLEQLFTFGEPGRDPRGRTVTVAYYALVRSQEHKVKAGSDASAANWYNARTLLSNLGGIDKLGFDHEDILRMALARLESKVRYAPIGFDLLPEEFSIADLHMLYVTILGRPIDKRNFYKKILAMNVLERQLGKKRSRDSGRTAAHYRFDQKAYDRLVKSGWNFEV